MRKGQSAMEYLMTYGWAILIVIVVAGVLAYYGVFSPGKLVGASVIGFSKVYVTQADFNSAGVLKVMVENRVGEEINVTKLAANSIQSDIADVKLAAGAKSGWLTATFSTLAGKTGDAYNINVAIEYELTSAMGTPLNSTGTIGGTRS